MGAFRLFLAFLVAFSHAPQSYTPLNLGVSAVVAFYFISGYLMTWQYQRFRQYSLHPAMSFYTDRFLRLYPLFFLVFFYMIFLYAASSRLSELINHKTLLELFILPQAFMPFMGGTTAVIPPAWSLGVELQFYLLLPFMFLFKTRTKLVLLFCLMGLQTLFFLVDYNLSQIAHLLDKKHFYDISSYMKNFCSWNSGGFSMPCDRKICDLLGYRWLPSAFIWFLLGNICYEMRESKLKPDAVFIGVSILVLLILSDLGALQHANVDEVLWGNIILIPMAAYFLKKMGDGTAASPIDRFLGQLAYPLFLVHYPARFIVEEIGISNFQVTLNLVLAVTLSILLAQIQNSVDQYRYRIRGFKKISGGQ